MDDEGEVLDMLVQTRRDAKAARKLLRRLMKNTGVRPETITTDGLASYRKPMRDDGISDRHRPGRLRANNRAENAHLPIRRRKRKQQRFKSQGSAQRFLASHAAVYNCFKISAHLFSRPTMRHFRAKAFRTWAEATKAA